MNCRGLGDKVKRIDVFNYMKEKNYSIICLQDIHVDPESEQRVTEEWGLNAVVCGYKSNARGVGIFFNNNFEYSLKSVKKAENKGYIILELEIGDKSFLLVTLYGPNEDNPSFYENLLRDLDESENKSILYVETGTLLWIRKKILKIIYM